MYRNQVDGHGTGSEIPTSAGTKSRFRRLLNSSTSLKEPPLCATLTAFFILEHGPCSHLTAVAAILCVRLCLRRGGDMKRKVSITKFRLLIVKKGNLAKRWTFSDIQSEKRNLLTTRHHWGIGEGSNTTHPPTPWTPPPPPKDWAKFSSGPSADQEFSVAPLAPIRLDQKVYLAPLDPHTHPPGPPPLLKGALLTVLGCLSLSILPTKYVLFLPHFPLGWSAL